MSILNKILLIVTNYKRYRYWKAKRKGKKFRDYKMGCGFYLPIGWINHSPYDKKLELKLQSGKVGLYELVSYKTYHDPDDMVEESWWNFIGYKEMKPIAQCSFYEFLSIYAPSRIQQPVTSN